MLDHPVRDSLCMNMFLLENEFNINKAVGYKGLYVQLEWRCKVNVKIVSHCYNTHTHTHQWGIQQITPPLCLSSKVFILLVCHVHEKHWKHIHMKNFIRKIPLHQPSPVYHITALALLSTMTFQPLFLHQMAIGTKLKRVMDSWTFISVIKTNPARQLDCWDFNAEFIQIYHENLPSETYIRSFRILPDQSELAWYACKWQP